MALVAPGIVRYTINGNYLGRPTANILDARVAGASGSIDRGLNILEYGEVIASCIVDFFLPILNSAWIVSTVTWVDLDNLQGSTGGTTQTGDPATALPQAGELNGEPISANTAILIDKQTVSARGQRGGRWFLPGIQEGFINGNNLDSVLLEPLQQACEDTQLRLDRSEASGLVANPVVVHTTTAGGGPGSEPVFVSATDVIGFIPQGQVASQRRRNRR